MTNTPTNREKVLAPVLMIFIKVSLLLFFACGVVEEFCKHVLHLGWPYDYPLLVPNQTFWDLTLYQYRFNFFHHPQFFQTNPYFPFMYPAPVAVLYDVFYRSPRPLQTFLGFILVSFLAAAAVLCRALLQRGVPMHKSVSFIAASLFLSYPLWFDIKQANIEIGIWVLVVLGVRAFCKGRGYSAAACFGIAGSMKIFPFVYLGLLFTKRKYREMLFAGLVAVVTTIVSLWLLGGPNILYTWRQIGAGLDVYRVGTMLHYHPGEIGFDHSVFTLVKCWYHSRGMSGLPDWILKAYLAIAAIAGIALYLLRIRYLPLINQVLCLSVASILLPPASADYTLMHLYVPWAMLVLFAQDQWNSGRNIAGLTAAFVTFAILLSPESEFIHHIEHVGGQIKALALIALMYIGLKYPFQREDDKAIAHPVAA